MFQEEIEKQQLRVVHYQELLSQAEQQQRRLGEKLRAESARADENENKLAALVEETKQIRFDLSAARQLSERIPKLELDLASAREEHKIATEHVEQLSQRVESKDRRTVELEAGLSEARAALRKLEDEVLPTRALVGALKAREKADASVKAELKLL